MAHNQSFERARKQQSEARSASPKHSARRARLARPSAAAQLRRYASGMKAALLCILSLPVLVNAQQLCAPVKSRGEGHWPIPEAEFTKERAESAAREMTDLLKRVDGSYMTSKDVGGLDVGPYILNRLVYIKGFALRSVALEDITHGEKEIAEWSTDAFCTFLAEEALVWH